MKVYVNVYVADGGGGRRGWRRWQTMRMAVTADDEDGGDGGWRRWTKTVDDVK